MSNRCPRPLAALVTVVCLSISCLAQSGEIASVKGELLSAIPTPFHDYWVELSDISHRTDLHRVDVKNDGSFEFHSVPAGEYRLCVTNLRGDPVFEQFVTINSLSGNLSVRLPGTPPPRSAPGTVSFTQLRHPPTPKAFQGNPEGSLALTTAMSLPLTTKTSSSALSAEDFLEDTSPLKAPWMESYLSR